MGEEGTLPKVDRISILVLLQPTSNTLLCRYTLRKLLLARSFHFHLASSSHRSCFAPTVEFDGFSGSNSIDLLLRSFACEHL